MSLEETERLEQEAAQMKSEREQLERYRKAKENRKIQKKLLKEERRKHSLLGRFLRKEII